MSLRLGGTALSVLSVMCLPLTAGASTTGGGTIDNLGLFTAGVGVSGRYTVQAQAVAAQGTATVSVSNVTSSRSGPRLDAPVMGAGCRASPEDAPMWMMLLLLGIAGRRRPAPMPLKTRPGPTRK